MNRTMEAIVWALNARGLSLAAWKVLVKGLSRRVGKRGFDVWPAHKQIAADCEISVSSVRRALQELEEGGWLKIVARVDAAGDRTSNLYRLQVRAKLSYPDEEIDIDPDDVDDDPSIPMPGSVQSEGTPPAQFEWTVPSKRADGLLTGEQGSIPKEPIPEEDSPSSDEEGPRDGDLFEGGLVEQFEKPPLEDFVEAEWHRLKADFPGVADVGILNDSRRKKIRARAAEVVRERKRKHGWICDEEDVWREIFEKIRASTFLTGRDPPGRGYTRPMKLTIDYVLRPSQFLQILDRDNDTASGHQSFDSDSGRRYGPAEEATRAALASLDAPRRRRAAG